MCLGIPGRVVSIVPGYADQLAVVDVVGAQRQVNVGMLEVTPGPGEWVLIHMGFAVEVVDAAAAERAMSGLELIGQPRPDQPQTGQPPPDQPQTGRAQTDELQTGRAQTGRARVRRRFRVAGLVQGVGFRPFAYATAARLALAGSVANTGDGVLIEVEGDPGAVDEYGRLLRTGAPPLAVVTGVDETDLEPRGGTGFTIDASRPGTDSDDAGRPGSGAGSGTGTGSGTGRTLASPDVAICADCRRELRDPQDRRYRHPFISCTNCGPRFTIITGLPYDRDATTMAGFPMCPACRAEYEDPSDRRFHAQPIACPDCGPRLRLRLSAAHRRTENGVEFADPIAEARHLLAAGKIVAVKGLGGFHLACDARNGAAVAELRRRKRRGGKPFAVMAADVDVAAGLACMSDDERALLTGVRHPIVLLRRRPGSGVADEVAPGNPDLGVMLPYTPLHLLLLDRPELLLDRAGLDVLVMTSGNLAGEPIVTEDEERLAPLVDAWLTHDRPIHVPCDDSVSRHAAGAVLPIRRSRGYAPMPVALPFDVPPVLAVGADLKNACALGAGRYAWVSQHIGDMDDLSTIDALTRIEAHLERLTGVRPSMLVADAHPGYRSSGWARAHAGDRPVHLVQHHHAHIASVMAEHGLGAQERVIGVAFDGTGYGPDGAVWGGEVLIAGYREYRRAAHLGYVALPGGEASVHRPYRMALSHLRAAGVPWSGLPPADACPPAERDLLDRQLATGFGCVPTSSMGRLFDAVASLTGVCHEAGYEAEAAIRLEAAARSAAVGVAPVGAASVRAAVARRYEFAVTPGGFDPSPVVRAVAADVRAGVDPGLIAAGFHAAVAAVIAEVAVRCRAGTGLDVVALGGGVFQNAVLIEAARDALAERGFTVLRPELLPPNDGGLALGQLVIGSSG